MGLLFSLSLLLAACGPTRPSGMMGGFGRDAGQDFASNGERIYFTATSQRGTAITFDMAGGGMMGGMPMRMGGGMACADCHGPDGRGGRVQMMMASFTAPNIRWETLTAADHGHAKGEDDHGNGVDEEAEMEHPPYTEETLKRAITQGLNPAGESLAWPMPRWQMSDEDLDDLVAHLKTLD
jgi:cytochrome c553